MKKLFLTSFLALFFTLCAFAKEGSSARGQTYYQFIIRPILKLDGNEFSKRYTQKQWKTIFLNDGKILKQIFQNEDFNTFLKTKKFLDIKNDLKVFVLEYARDTGSHAICADSN